MARRLDAYYEERWHMNVYRHAALALDIEETTHGNKEYRS